MTKRLALIIGNSLYRDKTLARLKSPDADVGALKDALSDPALGGFDDVNLVFNSASHIVRREIFDFFDRKNRNDLLLFYFSGHGVLDKNGRLYLAVKDTDTSALRGTAIPARYITEEMDNSRSQRQVLILDCCHSGAFERGTKGTTGLSVGTANVFEGSGYGRVVLTASDATQYAWEGNQVIGDAENSLFTHFFIQGIQTGEADADRDGKITIDEIYDYTYEKILEETSHQTPGKWSFKEQGELIISQSPLPEPGVEETSASRIQDLNKRYAEGLSAMYAENWDEAIQIFDDILELKPDFPNIREKIHEAERNKHNEDLYLQAVLDIESERFEEAKTKILQIQASQTEYKNTDKLLAHVNARLMEKESQGDSQKLKSSIQHEVAQEIAESDDPDDESQPGKGKTRLADLINWLVFPENRYKWNFGLRQAVLSLTGALVSGLLAQFVYAVTNVSPPMIFFPIPAFPAFLGIIFGPIVGFLSGGLGLVLHLSLNEGLFLIKWVEILAMGLIGMIPGLLYPVNNLRAPKNIIRCGSISLLGYLVGLFTAVMIRYSGDYHYFFSGLDGGKMVIILNFILLLPLLLIASDLLALRVKDKNE